MTTSYLVNRCPSTALGTKTLEEVWSRYPSNLDRPRIFGCVDYAHIRQDKIEPRAQRYMFFGYPEGVKAYKMWCLELGRKRYITSRYVIFDEAEMEFKKIDNVGRNAEIFVAELE